MPNYSADNRTKMQKFKSKISSNSLIIESATTVIATVGGALVTFFYVMPKITK